MKALYTWQKENDKEQISLMFKGVLFLLIKGCEKKSELSGKVLGKITAKGEGYNPQGNFVINVALLLM